MTSPFSTDKKYADQSGDEYCYIGRHPVRPKFPFVFSRRDGLDVWFTDENGVMCLNPHRTICEVKPKITRWMNVYRSVSGSNMWAGSLFESKGASNRCSAVSKRIACIKIEFEEGEGL